MLYDSSVRGNTEYLLSYARLTRAVADSHAFAKRSKICPELTPDRAEVSTPKKSLSPQLEGLRRRLSIP